LQAVEPNWLTTDVFEDPHRGQFTTLGLPVMRLLSGLLFSGGAIPYTRNLSLAASLIQSVVHTSSKTSRTSTSSIPSSLSLETMSF